MKRYVRAATVADLQAKIAKKQAEIDKKLAWIDKKEAAIQKFYNKIQAEISPEDFTALQNAVEFIKLNGICNCAEVNVTYDLFHKYNLKWGDPLDAAIDGARSAADSIHTSNYAIKDMQRILDGFKEKLAAETQKNDAVDDIPDCLKDFMQGIIEDWDEYDITLRDESQPYYRDLCRKADELLYADANGSRSGRVSDTKLLELYPNLPSYRRYTQFKEDYINIPFKRYFGASLQQAMPLWDKTDEQIHESNVKSARNLILDLLNRVTKITGPVRDWSGLHLDMGNKGAVLNGVVIGEDGTARVESIIAGGYHIQKEHIRTLVKEIH